MKKNPIIFTEEKDEFENDIIRLAGGSYFVIGNADLEDKLAFNLALEDGDLAKAQRIADRIGWEFIEEEAA
jgi:hypothetical protein